MKIVSIILRCIAALIVGYLLSWIVIDMFWGGVLAMFLDTGNSWWTSGIVRVILSGIGLPISMGIGALIGWLLSWIIQQDKIVGLIPIPVYLIHLVMDFIVVFSISPAGFWNIVVALLVCSMLLLSYIMLIVVSLSKTAKNQ